VPRALRWRVALREVRRRARARERSWKEQRDRRYELHNLLCLDSCPWWPSSRLRRWGVGGIHNRMHAGLLIVLIFAPSVCTRGGKGSGTCAPAVPDTPDVVTRDDLREPAGFDVPDFDEARVEEEDVRWMVRGTFGGALPFDS
jgi:hypothetical protein